MPAQEKCELVNDRLDMTFWSRPIFRRETNTILTVASPEFYQFHSNRGVHVVRQEHIRSDRMKPENRKIESGETTDFGGTFPPLSEHLQIRDVPCF